MLRLGLVVLGGADGTSARHPGHLHWSCYDAQAGQPSGGHFHKIVPACSYGGRRCVDRRVLQRAGTSWVWGIAR